MVRNQLSTLCTFLLFLATAEINMETGDARRFLSVGRMCACVMLADDEIVCWGLGCNIQPEGGTYTTLGASKFGATNCAIKGDTTLECFANDVYGSTSDMPSDSNTTGWVAVASGVGNVCASFRGASNPRTECWGSYQADINNKIPDTSTVYEMLVVGKIFACGITSALRLECWGSGGIYDTTPDVDFRYVDAGYFFWCGIDTSGTLHEGGDHIPGGLPAGSDWTDVACGVTFCCALKVTGEATCWGGNQWNIFESVLARNDWAILSISYTEGCGIDFSGDLHCFGKPNADIPDGPGALPKPIFVTHTPTYGPTEVPTETPTESPTTGPTQSPTTTPTESPTEQPTSSPTQTNFYIVHGKHDSACLNTDYPTCETTAVGMMETHAVRCCSDVNLGANWNKRSGCQVWADSPGCSMTTFADAYQICESFQARLCTRTELESDCSAGTGCFFNDWMVWSSTSTIPAQYYIGHGKSDGNCNSPDYPTCETTAVDVEETHAVRCCSDVNLGGWMKKSGCDVWAESDVPGCNTDTYANAYQICESFNARLCTITELENDCTAGTGCDFNDDMLWSSTTQANYYIVQGKHDSACLDTDYPTCKTTAVDMTETHAVRCCSDVDLGGAWMKKSGCDVWAESEVPGCSSDTYANAYQICESIQARLCTRTELESDCSAGTGCNFNDYMVWSSTRGW